MADTFNSDPGSDGFTRSSAIDLEPSIFGIRRATAEALLWDGRVVPITEAVNSYGALCEVDDPDAVSFVAGEGNQWFCDTFENFVPRVVH